MCCWIRKVSKNKKTRKQTKKQTNSPSPLPLPRREGSDYRDSQMILLTRNRWFKRKRGVNSELSFYKNIKQSNKQICCSVFLSFELSILNFEVWTLKFELWTLWYEPLTTTNFSDYAKTFILWTLNFELWTLWFVF